MTRFPGWQRPSPTAVALTLVALVAVACRGAGGVGDPNAQTAPVDSLMLAPGQEVRVDLLRLAFLEVTGDSRCPVDVTCVWQGNADVHVALGIGMGPSYPFVLQTADGMPTAVHAGYRVTLLALLPAPRSTETIRPEDYRAVFRVEEE